MRNDTAEKDEIYSFNIQACTQGMPTQAPTSSSLPSSSSFFPSMIQTSPPSTVPSSSSSPSSVPSSSTSPTGSYCIQITVLYDRYPDETSWELHKIIGGDENHNNLVYAYQASRGDTFYNESICLEEGSYKFTINDSALDGIDGIGHYNVTTTSEGELIAKGGEFEESETTSFSFPFVTGSSVVLELQPTPDQTYVPTLTPSSLIVSEAPTPGLLPATPSPFLTQTASPTLSSAPESATASPSMAPPLTNGLYCIQIYIVYDDTETIETSWGLYKIAGDNGVKEMVKFHYSASDDISFNETICLEKGEYEFSIYDSMANGICCENGEGHYNVTITTSNGGLIVEGGQFGASESTLFSLPPFDTIHRHRKHRIDTKNHKRYN